ncbi:MAG TPA: shikimate kinase, partial [Accumulibacter sp.]|nr:shikimate kinase [Accumulibacter sp.]
KVLARRLSYSFIDSDHEIARRTGVSVPTIFEIEGEEGFRKREAQIIAEIAALDTQVVATGGGVVLRPENRQLLLSSGLVVYLNVPLHTLYERTRHDKNRPLLQVQDPLQKLKELHIQRDPLYREVADIVVSGSRIALQSILPLIAQQI